MLITNFGMVIIYFQKQLYRLQYKNYLNYYLKLKDKYER